MYRDSSTDEHSDTAFVGSSRGTSEPFEWELPPLSSHLVYDLMARFDEDPTQLPGPLIFNLALKHSQEDVSPEILLRLMCAAAYMGYEPAQGLLPVFFSYLETAIPNDIDQHLRDYLANAVGTGSLLAGEKLQCFDHQTFTDARRAFKKSGGFNRFYTDIEYGAVDIRSNGRIPINRAMLVAHGHDWIHWFAIYASCQELLKYFDLACEFDLRSKTSSGETALYLACARGCKDIAEELLKRGSSPSVACTHANLTCLHWLFAFEEGEQAEVASRLVEHGAEIDAISTMDFPIYHYPFTLRQGSALRAVLMQCHSAIKALIDNGADPLLRNGSDPYAYDDRIRPFHTFRDPDREPCSVAEHPTLGLSPIDMAARISDPFIFQYLANISSNVDINGTDEEGLATIHHLTGSQIDRTLLGNPYRGRVFRGATIEQRSLLKQVISAMKMLGGNINIPVKRSCKTPSTSGQSNEIIGFTPLMLAMMDGDLDLMETLLDCGATAQYENSAGKTTMMCLGDPLHLTSMAAEQAYLKAVKLLVAHGAAIHSRSIEGETAVIVAAQHGYIAIVEFLLEQGADPDQVVPSEHCKNMWTYLARSDVTDKKDIAIASLLTRFVLPLTDHKKRYRILEEADEDNSSLLHYFAKAGMTNCVQALLGAECDLNKLRTRWITRSKDDGRRIRISWCMTPLDMALESGKEVENLENTGRFSPEHRGTLSQQMEKMIALLREKGGIEVRNSTIEEEEISDKDIFPKGARSWNTRMYGKAMSLAPEAER